MSGGPHSAAVNVVRCRVGGAEHFAVLQGERLSLVAGGAMSTGELFTRGRAALDAAASRAGDVALSDAELLSPVTPHQQFICQGINYESHLLEAGLRREDLPFNTIFTKASSSISAPHAPIVRPAGVELLDYEAELGLVLGTDITGPLSLTAENWHAVVAALVVVNDVSARDVQLPQVQFYKGKSFRSFGPVGPRLALMTPQLQRRFAELRIRLSVNNEPRQDFRAGEMIHKPWHTLNELSRLQDLWAGDLIATGTAAGVAVRSPGRVPRWIATALLPERRKWAIFLEQGRRNPRYLRPGDRVSTHIGTDDGLFDLGCQHNVVLDAADGGRG
jgi:2,4-didehydro-3-deoxy-L-rhamnonate hydrolase